MATSAEKDYFHLNVSVNKALNGIEAPLKSKHARSVIIAIHKSKEARSFWMIISRQPIMENRFTAWKFCHLLHKVLREGHECALQHSQKHTKMISELGKLWGHLHDDIGYCINAYSKLLVSKLKFHDKNRLYPGNLIITFAQIVSIADKDVNYYFQLCVEIFDYLEDIIALQTTVFSSINTYRISSMTQQGQCRLAPLITLIQDSNPLYDTSVRLMFKLHAKLPNDILSGHRERFCGIFARLKLFYENVRPLQYFNDLITVPQLPDQSPNFKSQVDFGSYIPPVVFVQNEPEPDPIVEDLVDTNSSQNNIKQDHILTERINVLETAIDDKNETIEQLKLKLDEWQNNYAGLEQSYKHNIQELQKSNIALSNDLALSKEMCVNIRMEKDDLELKLTDNPILIQKVFEEEEKQKLSSEKFNKLKLMYTQIRDEHINLLRQQSDHSKTLNKEKQLNSELLVQLKDLNSEILRKNDDIEAEKSISLKHLQEIENQKSYISSLESTVKETNIRYEAIIQKKENENLEINSQINILKESNMELTKVKLILQEKEKELEQAESLINKKNEEIFENLKKYEEKYLELSTKNEECQENNNVELGKVKLILQQKEEALEKAESLINKKDEESIENLKKHEKKYLELTTKNEELLEDKKLELDNVILILQKNEHELAKAATLINKKDEEIMENHKKYDLKYLELTAKNEELQENFQNNSRKLQAILDETEQKLQQLENALHKAEASLAQVNQEKVLSEKCLEDVKKKLMQHEVDLASALSKADALTNLNQQCEESLQKMRKLTIQTVQEVCASKLSDGDQQPLEEVLKISSQTEALLNKLKSSTQVPVEGWIENTQQVIYLGYYVVKLYDQCDIICTSTTEIEKGNDILSKARFIFPDLLQLFDKIQKDANREDINSVVAKIQITLGELNTLVQEMLSNFETSIDLDKLIEVELKEMEVAIEDAASKIIDLLSKSRENDNKIKLEVNEKILEGCTALMECIKVLILKSRVLQQEIVSSQKGNATANEFYKRNSQWSDGLISASKSVAKGANYLVEAANTAINNESGQNFELIVAAQEIAACTAQLVIASKVKANRDSQNLINLTAASRNVTKATGVVVATVKDGNLRQEQEQDIEFCKLTPSQLKTMEMDIQVKVLELEQALQTQRLKLSSFRKEHYQKTEY